MIKVDKDKNRDGIEFQYIDLGDLIRVSHQMYEMNDTHYNSGNFYGQCSICAKAIKNQEKFSEKKILYFYSRHFENKSFLIF